MTTNIELNKKLKNVKGFLGVFPCNLLTEIKILPASLIINTKPVPNKGEHWVALYIDNTGKGIYFDSYGLEPLVKEIKIYIEQNCTNGYSYNKTMVQGLTSIKCGEYCVLFVFLVSIQINMCNMIHLFTTNRKLNDAIIKTIYKKL